MNPVLSGNSSTRAQAVLQQTISRNTGMVVAGMVLLCGAFLLLLLWGDMLPLLRIVYPAVAFALGLLFYIAVPGQYVVFTWVIWFLSPFIRRVVDYQLGWQDPSLILLAPYLVAGVSFFTVLRHLPLVLEKKYVPFLLTALGIMVGFLVGITRVSIFSATNQLLQWMVPVMFGFHLAVTWQEYPVFRVRFKQVFTLGLLVMGLYALYQFFVLAEWDRFWMRNVQMGSIGAPRPFYVRVFSTMNSPAAFAYVTIPALLLMFYRTRLGSLLAVIPGFAGFMLSLVRAAWGGWVVGLAYVAWKSTSRMRSRLVALLVIGGVVVLPLLTTGLILDKISTRVSTLGDLSSDGSFRTRLAAYQGVAGRIFTDPIGYGLGGAAGSAQKVGNDYSAAGVLDSALLAIPLELGWLGAILYFGGLGLLCVRMLRAPRPPGDTFFPIASGIVMAMVALLFWGKTHMAAGGMVLWSFLGLTVAAGTYARQHPEAATE